MLMTEAATLLLVQTSEWQASQSTNTCIWPTAVVTKGFKYLRRCDFSFDQDLLKIQIVHSKTGQLRWGDEVLLARTNNCVWQVAMLEHYMGCIGMPLDDQRSLFRPIQTPKYRCSDMGILVFTDTDN